MDGREPLDALKPQSGTLFTRRASSYLGRWLCHHKGSKYQGSRAKRQNCFGLPLIHSRFLAFRFSHQLNMSCFSIPWVVREVAGSLGERALDTGLGIWKPHCRLRPPSHLPCGDCPLRASVSPFAKWGFGGFPNGLLASKMLSLPPGWGQKNDPQGQAMDTGVEESGHQMPSWGQIL